MSDDIYLTRAFVEKLHVEMDKIKRERIKIAGAIEEARLQGDLSENAEYDAAKEAQAHASMRLADIENKLSKAKVIEDQNIPSDKIYIGAIVDLEDLEEDEKIQYMLVAPEESNYEENKISIVSPVGRALLGKKEGEVLDIKVPAGMLKYKVLKIARP